MAGETRARDPYPTRHVPKGEYDRLRGILRSAPGPSFWYQGRLPGVPGPGRLRLVWKEGDLVPEGRKKPPYLRFGMDVYGRVIGGSRLLVWRTIPQARSRRAPTHVRLTVFDTHQLAPLTRTAARDREDPVKWSGGDLGGIDIPLSIKAGEHPIETPAAFAGVGTLVFHERHPVPGGRDRHLLFLLEPRSHRLKVLDFRWYIDGPFDHGYEWITVLTLDPATGLLVGDGFRMRPFLMKPSDGEFVAWIAPENPADRAKTNPWSR